MLCVPASAGYAPAMPGVFASQDSFCATRWRAFVRLCAGEWMRCYPPLRYVPAKTGVVASLESFAQCVGRPLSARTLGLGFVIATAGPCTRALCGYPALPCRHTMAPSAEFLAFLAAVPGGAGKPADFHRGIAEALEANEITSQLDLVEAIDTDFDLPPAMNAAAKTHIRRAIKEANRQATSSPFAVAQRGIFSPRRHGGGAGALAFRPTRPPAAALRGAVAPTRRPCLQPSKASGRKKRSRMSSSGIAWSRRTCTACPSPLA